MQDPQTATPPSPVAIATLNSRLRCLPPHHRLSHLRALARLVPDHSRRGREIAAALQEIAAPAAQHQEIAAPAARRASNVIAVQPGGAS